MPELLKKIYNTRFFESFLKAVQEVKPGLDSALFLKDIYQGDWEEKELKQRMRHITIVLKKHLSNDFNANSDFILELIPQLEKNGFKPDNLEFIFLPDFIELYGIEFLYKSIEAFEKITQFVTCEFGVRPFIINHPKKMMSQMLRWSENKHPMVRRLSTEGCRPRLPWAMGLPFLKKDPKPIIPILKKLKNDQSESVRRSVSNNLNDISKDHPQLVVKLVKSWQGESKETDWVIKHACRTLLKQGNPDVMEMFGFGSTKEIRIEDFRIAKPKIKIGEFLEFSFKIVNTSNSVTKMRLEYGLYYQKANGSLSRKVFVISEKEYASNSNTLIIRKQSFKPITTRKYHLGAHRISIIINGVEYDKHDFELVQK